MQFSELSFYGKLRAFERSVATLEALVIFKGRLQWFLRIDSPHKIEEVHDLEIALIFHVSNFFST